MQLYKVKKLTNKTSVFKSGGITVFMSLLCAIIIVFIQAIVSGVKYDCARVTIQSIADISIRSSFSEYNRELFDRYGLLYVDTTYKGVSTGGEGSFCNHILRYTDANISDSVSNLYSLKILSATLSEVQYASDNDYESLMHQIWLCMTKTKGYSPDIPEEVLLDEYIYLFISQDDISDMTFDEKKRLVVSTIENDMYDCYGYCFDFNYHLESACVTIFMEDNRTVYECTRYMSLAQ